MYEMCKYLSTYHPGEGMGRGMAGGQGGGGKWGVGKHSVDLDRSIVYSTYILYIHTYIHM